MPDSDIPDSATPDNEGSRAGPDPQRDPFITIDDLVAQAQELVRGLRQLSQYKHPLDIRRGVRKGVSAHMKGDRPSKQLKASGRTYFLDIEQTREGQAYLRITESRKGQGGEWERHSIHLFPEDADAFVQALTAMAAKLDQAASD